MDELTQKKIEQLNKQPIIETNVNKSADGRWITTKTTITDIKSVKYFEKVLNGGKEQEGGKNKNN
ncbi:hypothetical protein ISS05_03885 [Candidatus Woesearchaeota archaeon]|nr:hypothetical protein [Candidatus Woesearchaeota archaeon]